MNTLSRKLLRDLRAAAAQSIALTLIVALGIVSLIALTGAYRNLSTSYNHTYEQLKFADVTFTVRAAPEAVIESIARVDGVAAVSGRLIVDTGFELPDGEPIRSRLVGLRPDQRPTVNDLLIEEGRYLEKEDTRVTVLETHFSQFYDLHPGDTITPILAGEKVPLTVVGVAASPEYLIVSPSRHDILPAARTFAVLFLPLPELQALVNAADRINNIAVRVRPEADRDQVVRAIQDLLSPYGLASTTLREDQPSHAALQLDLEGFREWAYLMPGLILIVAAMSVYIMLGRLVRAQQPQIGLMKALGYSNQTIMGHYLTFALIIGAVGSLVGILGGLPMARWITGTYATELGIPLVKTRFYPELAVSGVFLSLLFTALAGLGPARASARLDPARAMYVDPAAALVKGRPTPLEQVVQPPLWLRLSLRDVFRIRRRSLSTVLGVVFAFVLVLMSWGMIDAMEYMLSHTFRDTERWDVTVTFSDLQTEAMLEVIRSWPGIRQVESILQSPATLKANGKEKDVLLTALDPGQSLHVLELKKGQTPATALASGHIVLTPIIAEELGLAVGETLTVETPLGGSTFTVGGLSDELMASVAYISLTDAYALAGTPVPVFNGLYLAVEPGWAPAIKNALYYAPGVTSAQLKADIESDWRSLLGLFYVFMGIIMGFALVMAFALLFNAMTINVLERQRELATMRAIGASATYIANLMSVENLIVWLIALVPGLILGWWVARQMGARFQSDLFFFRVVIHPTSYGITALGIVLTMFLSALPAIRHVNRLNLAEATKVIT